MPTISTISVVTLCLASAATGEPAVIPEPPASEPPASEPPAAVPPAAVPPASVDPWSAPPSDSAERPQSVQRLDTERPLTSARAPTPARQKTPPDDDEPDRNGFALSVATGVASCAQPICAVARPAAIGRFSFGYRLPAVEFVLDTSIAGSRFVAPHDFGAEKGRQTFWDLTVGVRWYPVQHHRFEPYVGLGIGAFRLRWRSEAGSVRAEDVMTRGLLRASVGLDIRIGKHFALGPRYDHGWPFAGEECVSNNPCRSLPEAWISEGSNDTAEAQLRRGLPRPWSFTLVVRAIF